MKNSPRPLLLHQTLQLALCIRTGRVLLSSAKPRFVWLPDGEARFITLENESTAPVQWRQALHHSSRHLALRMVILGLCAAARPWKPISWSTRWTVLVLTLLPEAVWNSVVSVATKDRRFLRVTHFSTLMWMFCVFAHTVEVGSLHTLRLESSKLVFQPIHKLLTNYSFGKSVRTSTLCMTQVIFPTIVYTQIISTKKFTVLQFQWVRSVHTLSWLSL